MYHTLLSDVVLLIAHLWVAYGPLQDVERQEQEVEGEGQGEATHSLQ